MLLAVKIRKRCVSIHLYCSGRSLVSQTVSSVYCLSVLTSLISRLYDLCDIWLWLSGVCSQLVNQLSRLSRW